jgi:hypothetical protein
MRRPVDVKAHFFFLLSFSLFLFSQAAPVAILICRLTGRVPRPKSTWAATSKRAIGKVLTV